ncbi:MAG TPA: LLM class flavin-dependent oxidoreductase [Stellaceae bacterium]|nr:LLM class flavin-dependent oxidoreductase [Stellaceae bacterium]
MEFGIFDHVDRNGLPLDQFYEMRLALTEAYDRLGFRSYHIAEHHATPLGMAPSPSIFLSAVAQRTKRLRFGPLVYLLPLYHPLRLAEEICMLDHMSHGRFELGVGRGVSPVEVGFYGVDPEARAALFAEALAALKAALTSERLDFTSEHWAFRDVPMELRPLQQPHPPLWVGVENPEGAERAARERINFITAHPVDAARAIMAAARAAAPGATQLMGLARFIVIAESDDEALALARRAYPKWQQALTYLPRVFGYATRNPRPAEFDAIRNGGRGVAGAPATVAAELKAQLAESGANYCVGQFAFGDMSRDEALRSIELFARHVMPQLR